LLRTLEIYFQENESLTLAAEKLFIHANTLRNRLKKIESILGVELNQADVRVRFYVACQALRITRQIM
jgi:DNA-binding PucR family transcriptional regulator